MMPVMVLGLVVFELRHNLSGVSGEVEQDFAEHKVLGASPIYERMVGPERERTIKGTTFPMDPDYGPASAVIAVIDAMIQSGQPQHLMRGDGFGLGWFLVTKLKTDGESLGQSGVPHKIDFTISLTQCDAPPVSGIASIISDLFL